MKLWRVMFVILGLLGASPTFAFTLNLDAQKWHLLSLPGSEAQSVSQIFSGQLAAADYDSTWAVFTYDEQQNAYSLANVNGSIEEGAAFWFQHLSSNPIAIEIDLFAPSVALNNQAPCPSSFGCFDYPLATGDGVRWTLIGTPFPEGVEINDLILVTSSGACQNGCTLEQASNANLASESFFRLGSGSQGYDAVGSGDMLKAGDGHWFGTSIAAEFGPARLVIPTYCTPFT